MDKKQERKRPHWADRQLDAFYESADGELPDVARRTFDKIYKFFDDHWHMIEGICDDPRKELSWLKYLCSMNWKTILNQRIALRKLQKAYERSLRRLKNAKAEIKKCYGQ